MWKEHQCHFCVGTAREPTMMRLVLLAGVFFATKSSTASTGPVSEACLRCICIVESNCMIPVPLCRQDGGSLSCGPYQIKKAYWEDARLKGGNLLGDWRSCAASLNCSKRAVQGYMERYATRIRLGHNPTCRDFARIHNGGPRGFKKCSTIGYWNKVKSCLEK